MLGQLAGDLGAMAAPSKPAVHEHLAMFRVLQLALAVVALGLGVLVLLGRLDGANLVTVGLPLHE